MKCPHEHYYRWGLTSGLLVLIVLTGVGGCATTGASEERGPRRPAPPADPDRDRDGIPVPQDLCPDQPETFNHFQDDDGCPDRSPVTVLKDRIVLEEPVHFRPGGVAILEHSMDLLKVLADTLKARKDLARVEIGVHSDQRGLASFNLRLSQHRAEAIRDFLMQQGVAGTRLVAKGFGESKPLCTGSDPGCQSRNRRTELLLFK